MRQYELWLAMALALILMLQLSCRSRQAVVRNTIDSTAVRSLRLAGLSKRMTELTFDSMEIVEVVDGWDIREQVRSMKNDKEEVGRMDKSVRRKVRIKGGRWSEAAQQTSIVQCNDSVVTEKQEVSERSNDRGHGLHRWLATVVMAILIMYACKYHLRRWQKG